MGITADSETPVGPPEAITASHKLEGFECGELDLDEWLVERALKNEESGASRTFVVCHGGRVIGYYSLAAAAISQEFATGRVRRNMPNPIPAVLLGRLAVDSSMQGRRIGQSLLHDAVRRVLRASEVAGIRAILVHAISETAKKFYMDFGFVASPAAPMILMMTLDDARTAFRIATPPHA